MPIDYENNIKMAREDIKKATTAKDLEMKQSGEEYKNNLEAKKLAI